MVRKKTHEEFVAEVKALVGDEYVIASEYEGASKKIQINHMICGTAWGITPSNFRKGKRCPKCAKNLRKDTQSFKEEIFALHGNEYTVLGEYKNAHTKIMVTHTTCGGEYLVAPKHMVNGVTCPNCRESAGERAIRLFLTAHKLDFKTEYKLEGCIHRKKLRFDFCVFDYRKGIKTLIEYDGKQHFDAVDHFGGDSYLELTQRRDAIKDKYCADHGIPLIRIPYWDFDNIDAILTEKLLPLLVDVNLVGNKAS